MPNVTTDIVITTDTIISSTTKPEAVDTSRADAGHRCRRTPPAPAPQHRESISRSAQAFLEGL